MRIFFILNHLENDLKQDLHPDLVIEMKSHSNLSFDMDFENGVMTIWLYLDFEKDWHSDLSFQKALHSNLYIDQAWQIVKQPKMWLSTCCVLLQQLEQSCCILEAL